MRLNAHKVRLAVVNFIARCMETSLRVETVILLNTTRAHSGLKAICPLFAYASFVKCWYCIERYEKRTKPSAAKRLN